MPAVSSAIESDRSTDPHSTSGRAEAERTRRVGTRRRRRGRAGVSRCLTLEAHTRGMPEVQVGQVWEQVSKHERGMQLEVVRGTGRRWILRPIGGGPSKKRGLREGLWTLSSEQLNTTCRLVRGAS
jgi:hypothetical protein